MKLAIATPFYLQGFPQYIVSLLQSTQLLSSLNIDWTFITVINDSYVDRAKNTIVYKFLQSDCTDLLMIDSDLSWDQNSFLKFISIQKEIVACVYPTKNAWEQYCCTIHTNENLTPKLDGELIEAVTVPGGFIKYKRSTFEKIIAAYPEDYYYDRTADKQTDNKTADIYHGRYYNFFCCNVMNHSRFGEDINFFKKWNELNEKVYIHPDMSLMHFGTEAHYGNYHEFLLKQPQPKVQLEQKQESQPEPKQDFKLKLSSSITKLLDEEIDRINKGAQL